MFFESLSNMEPELQGQIVSSLGKAGAAFAISFAAMGSAIGTGLAGMSAVLAWKKCYAQEKMAPFMLVAFVGAPLTQTIYGMIVMKRLRVEGFLVMDFAERYSEAITALGQWMAEGKIKVRTEVVDGLENAVEALKKIFTGANTGKLVVRVEDV